MMDMPTKTALPSLRRRLVTLHRWLGLGAALFWLIQAITGVMILFHWEVTDNAVAGAHRPTDLAAIERRIETLAPAGSEATIGSVWTTAGLPDRYDINMTGADGISRTMRVAGDGTVLRTQGPGEGHLLDTAVEIHHTLLAGDLGDWIVTISGMLLLSNLIFGIVAAWPPRGRWSTVLKPVNKGPAVARLYGWHRAIGLWVAIPAVVLVGAGTLIKFEDSLGPLIGAESISLPPVAPSGQPVGFATAAGAALGAIPGSTLTAVAYPKEDDATYRVRVRAPDEIRRAYGASVVMIDANTGAVRDIFPIAEAQARRAFMTALYPIHTGEAGGTIGRLLTGLIGVWLATMVVVGTLLWYRRTRKRPARS